MYKVQKIDKRDMVFCLPQVEQPACCSVIGQQGLP